MSYSDDIKFMGMALAEGRKAVPDCKDNPPVGCVLVDEDDNVIGRGYTQPPGQDHAEAMALRKLPEGRHGITAYVTLEPCAFHGRTPSCAEALVESGVDRVVVAMLDPDPRNAGAGIAILKQAGITVRLGVLAEEAEADMGKYLHK